MKQNAVVTTIGAARGDALKQLSQGGFKFAVLQPQQPPLIIGSFPVAFVVGAGQSVFARPKQELWLAIDPRVAVSPVEDPSKTTQCTFTEQQIHEINRAVFDQSTVVASADKTTIDTLSATYASPKVVKKEVSA
jgi:hypothetical protein